MLTVCAAVVLSLAPPGCGGSGPEEVEEVDEGDEGTSGGDGCDDGSACGVATDGPEAPARAAWHVVFADDFEDGLRDEWGVEYGEPKQIQVASEKLGGKTNRFVRSSVGKGEKPWKVIDGQCESSGNKVYRAEIKLYGEKMADGHPLDLKKGAWHVAFRMRHPAVDDDRQHDILMQIHGPLANGSWSSPNFTIRIDEGTLAVERANFPSYGDPVRSKGASFGYEQDRWYQYDVYYEYSSVGNDGGIRVLRDGVEVYELTKDQSDHKRKALWLKLGAYPGCMVESQRRTVDIDDVVIRKRS